MAFLNNIRGMPMPPIKNVVKDVWQQAKESIPDRQRQAEYDDPTSEYGGSSQISHGSSASQRPHNVHFADTVGGGGGFDQQPPTELNPLNPFKNASSNGTSSTNPFNYTDESTGGYQYQETPFNKGDYNYQDGGNFPPR
jgi:solute carrier family 32 (vesicular inhibitory amino acid transporter)